MVSLDRHHATLTALVALCALAGCAFEGREIVVDDAWQPDAVAPLDALDEALDAASELPPAPDVAEEFDAPEDVDVPDVIDAPEVITAPDVIDVMDVPVSSSRAGALCTRPDPAGGVDMACGALLRCLPSESTPVCSLDCFNNPSQASEQAMCGGAGATCLTYGDAPDDSSRCARACDPSARGSAAGACRAGFVCTGWWFTHGSGAPDVPGCAGFCARDSDCPTGTRCNTREGLCGTRLPDLTRLRDGEPCDPTRTELLPGETFRRNTQCRGVCFGASSDPTEGLCGSYLDLAQSGACPDDPTRVRPLTGSGPDNLALCIERECTRNADCRLPLVCRYYEDAMGTPVRTGARLCLYPTPSQRVGTP